MEEAIAAIRQVLDSNDIRYNENENFGIYKFYMTFSLSQSKLSSIIVVLNVTTDFDNPDECLSITSHGLIGIKADESCMAEMGEFLHRANYGMRFGCFEMDYDDGEIRFKNSVNCKDDFPSHESIKNLCYIPVVMADRYGNGILAVSLGLTSAKDAIEKIES
jgi:hypothetical protein